MYAAAVCQAPWRKQKLPESDQPMRLEEKEMMVEFEAGLPVKKSYQ